MYHHVLQAKEHSQRIQQTSVCEYVHPTATVIQGADTVYQDATVANSQMSHPGYACLCALSIPHYMLTRALIVVLTCARPGDMHTSEIVHV